MNRRNHNFAIQQLISDASASSMWTKGDMFHFFHLIQNTTTWPKSLECPQYAANFFIAKKTNTITQFFRQWSQLMEHYHLVSDEPSVLVQNHPTFIENRHDQSILSLLLQYAYTDGSGSKQHFYETRTEPYVSPTQWSYIADKKTFTFHLDKSVPHFTDTTPHKTTTNDDDVDETATTTTTTTPSISTWDLSAALKDYKCDRKKIKITNSRWNELDGALKEQAKILGYDSQARWDYDFDDEYDGDDEYSFELPIYSTPFAHLTRQEQNAVMELDLQREFVYKNFARSDWIDLPLDIQQSAKRIGYTEKLWDSDQLPSSNVFSKSWTNLTAEEQKTITYLGIESEFSQQREKEHS